MSVFPFFDSNLHSKSKKITRSKAVIKHDKTTFRPPFWGTQESHQRIDAKNHRFPDGKATGLHLWWFSGLAENICAFCVVIFLSTKTKQETIFLPFFTCWNVPWRIFVGFLLLCFFCCLFLAAIMVLWNQWSQQRRTLNPVESRWSESFKKSRRRKEMASWMSSFFGGEGEVLAETSIFVWQRWFWFNLS